MKYLKRIAALLLSAVMLSGCTILSSGDDLLQTPRASKSYLLLEQKLVGLGENMTPISPQSGQYRNTVIFEDLNGDGEDEAIAFMRQGAGGQIFVYIFQLADDAYEQIGCITGQGTAIGSLSFLSFSKDGRNKGMILTWTLSNSVEHGMTVCGMKDGQMQGLTELEYTDYTTCDLDGDDADELLALNYSDNARKCAQLYDYQEGKMVLQSQADATQDVQSIANITTGQLESGEMAVFVDNKFEKDNGMQTDIYAVTGKTLDNLALTSGASTYRPVSMYYSDDVDGDGMVEIPQLWAMKGYEKAPQQEIQWEIDWYQYSLDPDKERFRAFTTYSSLSEEWSLIFPTNWRGHVTVTTTGDSDVSQTIFSDAKTSEVLVTIYVFGGADRQTASKAGDLITLGLSSSNCYSAKINSNAESELAIGETRIRRNFSIVQKEWY